MYDDTGLKKVLSEMKKIEIGKMEWFEREENCRRFSLLSACTLYLRAEGLGAPISRSKRISS